MVPQVFPKPGTWWRAQTSRQRSGRYNLGKRANFGLEAKHFKVPIKNSPLFNFYGPIVGFFWEQRNSSALGGLFCVCKHWFSRNQNWVVAGRGFMSEHETFEGTTCPVISPADLQSIWMADQRLRRPVRSWFWQRSFKRRPWREAKGPTRGVETILGELMGNIPQSIVSRTYLLVLR